MDAAADIANTQVLVHPLKAKAVVYSGNGVGADVAKFNKRLGIQQERATLEAKRWGEAIGDARDTVLHAPEAGATATVRFSAEAFANAKAAGEGLSQRVTEWLPRSQKDGPGSDEDGSQQQER